ncbi:unannotated protein [freshwater metagenome]|jgi:hypothetical protein|uniref:Unannotated protein n=1 Tax=freshwater metagenome TaxID=449393 RepID=A0A6J6AME2_9ZZZZ
MEADFFFVALFTSVASELSTASDFLEVDFLAARLRGVFGSIAMAPNPLCV